MYNEIYCMNAAYCLVQAGIDNICFDCCVFFNIASNIFVQ